ncbi:MAG: hypothetical protein ABIJ45_11700 [Candidatus Zixiibacteriota bacterium]
MKSYNRSILLITLISSIILYSTSFGSEQGIAQDTVILKNGEILYGTVYEYVTDKSIKIITTDGKILIIKNYKVEKNTWKPIIQTENIMETPHSKTEINSPTTIKNDKAIESAIPKITISDVEFEEIKDVVYLNNGEVLYGTVFEHTANKSIKVITIDGNIEIYKNSDILRTSQEPIKIIQSPKVYSERKSGTSFFTLIIPGGGHIYNGDIGRGFAFLGVNLLGLGWMILPEFNGFNKIEKGVIVGTGSVIFFGSYIWSIVDSEKIDDRLKKNYNHSIITYPVSEKILVDVGISDIGADNRAYARAVLNF